MFEKKGIEDKSGFKTAHEPHQINFKFYGGFSKYLSRIQQLTKQIAEPTE